MKIKHLLLTIAVLAGSLAATGADAFVNLTPKPKAMTVSDGSYSLRNGLTVSSNGLKPDWAFEAARFTVDLNRATGLGAELTGAKQADITVAVDTLIAPEGYRLNVTPAGVAIAASTTDGLYYAFQTLKKILPPNVMAGVKKEGAYSLPLVAIDDEPRYDYRGFMLDVSRHFFTVEEVKRMLDVMSYYKLNRFHWHLTDDQGWRIEMPEYPRLTTVGATAPNRRFTDMHAKTQYWLNKPYGPYFYTQEQLRDVVAYAKARHIEVVPEVDMPGHFCAAMTAYPEFSCTPQGEHRVWHDGGISSDVLNVENPAAVKFAKDILDTLMDIFPYKTIHIGGDECPTTAWEQNAECQAAYKANGFTSPRQHQTKFIKAMADHLKANGREIALWNEAVIENGADLDMVRDTDATIYCWTVGTADKGAEVATGLGLRSIYTPWGPYYINRVQDKQNDPPAAGQGGDDVKATYNLVPFRTLADGDAPECYGVQGTFWCEHVSDREYMEWLALPRLIAIAEAGWTPQSGKDWPDFRKRMSADRDLLDLNGYPYSPHHMFPREN